MLYLIIGIRQCFKQECPEETFACEKLTHVSEDKKHIVADIHCLDLKGTLLFLIVFQHILVTRQTYFKTKKKTTYLDRQNKLNLKLKK